MTDFSHLHELEERAKRTQNQMLRVQKNDAEWNQLAIQLFQTEQEIADERTFLGLEDMDAGKDQHNSLDSRPFGKWNCTYCRCVEYDAVTDEPFSGGLGDEATQRAWMKYAENQGIPHDHEDEESFKYGFDAGASSGNRKAKLEIAEEIENHSYLAGTHEMCVWIDGLTKRLREESK